MANATPAKPNKNNLVFIERFDFLVSSAICLSDLRAVFANALNVKALPPPPMLW